MTDIPKFTPHQQYMLIAMRYQAAVAKQRYINRNYRFKLSRAVQLNQLRKRGDWKAFNWLKDFMRWNGEMKCSR